MQGLHESNRVPSYKMIFMRATQSCLFTKGGLQLQDRWNWGARGANGSRKSLAMMDSKLSTLNDHGLLMPPLQNFGPSSGPPELHYNTWHSILNFCIHIRLEESYNNGFILQTDPGESIFQIIQIASNNIKIHKIPNKIKPLFLALQECDSTLSCDSDLNGLTSRYWRKNKWKARKNDTNFKKKS